MLNVITVNSIFLQFCIAFPSTKYSMLYDQSSSLSALPATLNTLCCTMYAQSSTSYSLHATLYNLPSTLFLSTTCTLPSKNGYNQRYMENWEQHILGVVCGTSRLNALDQIMQLFDYVITIIYIWYMWEKYATN